MSHVDCDSVGLVSGDWDAVRIEGATTARVRMESFSASDDGWGPDRFPSREIAIAAFDYDGDGAAEVVVRFQMDQLFDMPNPVHLVSPKNGELHDVGMPNGFHIATMEDFDGDERPDFDTGEPFSFRATDYESMGHQSISFVFPLLIHAQPGGRFSVDDAVAHAFAKTQCPTRPAVRDVVAVGPDGAIDANATAHAVACARVWGVPSPTLTSALRQACHGFSARDTRSMIAARGRTCPAWLLAEAAIKPPLTLK